VTTSDLFQDVRQAIRSLLRQPGFAAAAVLTLGLGIGATTAIFTVVNSVLIRPLPYPDADQLVRIAHNIGGIDQAYFSDEIFLTYQQNTQAFQDLGVWIPAGRANVTGQGDPEEVRALAVSRGLLTTLGMRPEVGRWFSAEDEAPAAPDAVMLGHPYWQRKFARDRSVVGRVMIVDSRPYQIVGVMPAAFRFRGEHDVIRLLRIDAGRPIPGFRLNGVARLQPGVTLAQAGADVTRMFPIWIKDPALRARWAPALRPLKQDVVGDIGNTLWVLMGTIGVVLLMACANVANLLLVRADGRRQELAIRAALGAGWMRLALTMLIESLALAALGGLLGVALAYAGVRALVAMGPANLPRLLEISLDSQALVFALVVSLFSGLLFGAIPIFKYVRPEPAATLASAGRSCTITRERHRSNNALVAAQMALALLLLVSAALMIRSFQALRTVAPGFTRPHEVQTFAFSIPATEVAEPQRVTRLQHEIVEKIAAIPGVSATAFTTRLPMDETNRSSAAISAENRPESRPTPPNRHVRFVSPGLFHTLGTPLVAGRDFTWTDVYERREVAIVSENLAREFWGSPIAALGQRVREFYDGSSPWREVVGVAGNVHDDGVHQASPATVYWPAQWTSRTFAAPGYQPRRVAVAVRSERVGSQGLLREIEEAVQSVHANLALAQVRTLGDVYDQSMARTSFTLVMLTIAGMMALLLGVFGLYGVLSYMVTRRRREIGIRLALGAEPRQIRRLFVGRALALAAVGGTIGLAAAAASTRLMQSLLYGVGPLDPITFTATPLLLAAAAVLASYLPARRAVSIDPVETLRAD
jgi:predicted permease